MPGWGRDAGMGGCPAPFFSGSHAAPGTSGVLRPPARCWPCRGVALLVLAPEKGFGLHTPSSRTCLRGPPPHCPSPAAPCEVLGDGDVLVSCHAITERWHRAVRGPRCSRLQRAGRRMLRAGGVPAGPSWPRRGGSDHGGSCLPIRTWHAVAAGWCHGQPRRQGPSCPAQITAWWDQGTQWGLAVRVLSVCSIVELGKP